MRHPTLEVVITTALALSSYFLYACEHDEDERQPAVADAGSKREPSTAMDAAVADAAVGGIEPRDAGAVVPSEATDAAAGALAQDASQPFFVCAGDLPIMKVRDPTTNAAMEPDWSCFDAPDDEAAADAGTAAHAATESIQFRLGIGPLSDAPDLAQRILTFTMGVTVDLYFGASTLGKPAVTRTFDQYMVSVDVPSGTPSLSARIRPLERAMAGLSIVESREYGIPLPSAATGAAAEAAFTVRDSRKLAANLVLEGGQEDLTKASLVALARDCRGRDVSGAQLELIDGATNLPLTGEARSAYSRFALPDPTCTFSNAEQPAWWMVNAPVNTSGATKTHSYRLRLKGRMRTGDRAPVVFGETELELFPGIVTRVDSLPRVAAAVASQ